jgi:hypothetical protein
MASARSHVALLAAGAVALACSVPAFAADRTPPVPPPTPSIAQYVETVPTSQGGATAGSGQRNVNSLPPAVAKKLNAHPDALTKRLKSIATSSAYGAPQQGLSPTDSKAQNSLSAAVSAATDSSDSHVFWLLGAVIVVTTAMVWATARRHRA